MTALTVPDVLRRAESLIAGHWSRTGYEYRSGCYCPIEALDEACPDEPAHAWLFIEAYAVLREEVGGDVTVWNGLPERTEAEVRAALLAAARRAEAGQTDRPYRCEGCGKTSRIARHEPGCPVAAAFDREAGTA